MSWWRPSDVGFAVRSKLADVGWSAQLFTRLLAHGVESRRFLSADGEIFRQHRVRNVEHEHDVDAARFDLREAFA